MPKYIVILLFISVLLFPKPIFAQQKTAVQPNLPKQMVRITPIFIDMPLTKAGENTYLLKIENLYPVPIGIKTSLQSLDPTDEESGVQFGEPKQNQPFITWISLSDKDFLIPENGSKTITITVIPPKEAKDGGYYGILFLTPIVSKPLDKTSPTVVSRIGALMFASIGTPKAAKPEQKAKIEEFKFIDNYSDKTPEMVLRAKSTYPYLISAKATADIKQILGKTRIIKLEDKRILPDKIRRWTKPVELPIGIYSANVAVSLGGGEMIYKKTYLPYLAFLLIVLILILGRKRLKKAFVVLIKGSKH